MPILAWGCLPTGSRQSFLPRMNNPRQVANFKPVPHTQPSENSQSDFVRFLGDAHQRRPAGGIPHSFSSLNTIMIPPARLDKMLPAVAVICPVPFLRRLRGQRLPAVQRLPSFFHSVRVAPRHHCKSCETLNGSREERPAIPVFPSVTSIHMQSSQELLAVRYA